MKRKLKLAAVLASTVLSLWGCQMKKEDTVNVVTEQPVLGVDVIGYEGFSHLSAYTLEGEASSVLYLPTDDYAYVGGTCIISKKEGVEATLNLNPLLSEEYANKTLKQKLQYMLDSEYSVNYRKNYADLEISDIESLENGAVKAEVSYLVFDDEKKGYVGQWLDYYLTELEDGRTFKVVLRVDSSLETGQSGEVVEELEKYFETDFAYEDGFLQAKIDGYNPSEDELARMTGNTIPFGDFYIYLPEGWVKNTVYSNLLPGGTFYGLNGNSVEQNQLLCTIVMDAVGDSAELGTLTKGEQQIFADIFEEQLSQQYGGVNVETHMLGMTELGFVFTARVKDYAEPGTEMYIYYICRGTKIYGIGGTTIKSGADESELVELVDSIYSSMEAR